MKYLVSTVLVCWLINVAALVIAFILMVATVRFSYVGEGLTLLKVIDSIALGVVCLGCYGSWAYARARLLNSQWGTWRPNLHSVRGIVMSFISILPMVAFFLLDILMAIKDSRHHS